MRGNKKRRVFVSLLAFLMLASFVPISGLCETKDSGTAVDNVSSYVYLYDNYLHRSPHRYSYTVGETVHEGYVPAMYKLKNELSNQGHVYGYCCDLVTSVKHDTRYRRVNLEDADYYDDTSAKHIRSILKNGYWYWGKCTCDVNTPSGCAVHNKLRQLEEKANDALGSNDEKKVCELTAAEALSATQGAIWHYANDDGSINNYKIYSKTKEIKDFHDISDPYTVNVSEGKSEYTQNNIEGVFNYLINLPGEEAKQVICNFEQAEEVFAIIDEDSSKLIVPISINGTIKDGDKVTLKAQLKRGSEDYRDAQVINLTGADIKNTIQIAFDNIGLDALEEITSAVVSLSGTQYFNEDVFFYEPEGGRKAAQCFVGFAEGETPIRAEKEIRFNHIELKIFKYDGSFEQGNSRPIEGVKFGLYYKNGEGDYKPVPGTNEKATNSDGEIVWNILCTDINTQYYCKETEAPEGFIPLADKTEYIPISTTEETKIENCHQLGEITFSKKLINSSFTEHQHFNFRVCLDYKEAILSDRYDPEEIENKYKSLAAEYIKTCEGNGHQEILTFEKTEEGHLQAIVELAGGESVTITGVPFGTKYTIEELDENGDPVSEGDFIYINNRVFASQSQIIEGTVGVASELEQTEEFTNSEVAIGTLQIMGTKYLDMNPSQKTFSFILYDLNDESKPVQIEKVQNDKDGVFVFSEIRYDREGTYTYLVKEEYVGKPYSFDSTGFIIQVNVRYDEEKSEFVVGEPVITYAGSQRPADSISFYNETIEYVDLTVIKEWKLDNGGKPSQKILVGLYKDGILEEKVELSDENAWTYTWKELEKEHEWEIKETTKLSGFSTSVVKDGFVTTIINDDIDFPPDDEGEVKGIDYNEKVPRTADDSLPFGWIIAINFAALGIFSLSKLTTAKNQR